MTTRGAVSSGDHGILVPTFPACAGKWGRHWGWLRPCWATQPEMGQGKLRVPPCSGSECSTINSTVSYGCKWQREMMNDPCHKQLDQRCGKAVRLVWLWWAKKQLDHSHNVLPRTESPLSQQHVVKCCLFRWKVPEADRPQPEQFLTPGGVKQPAITVTCLFPVSRSFLDPYSDLKLLKWLIHH